MEDGDSMTNNLNVFNTLVSQLIFVDIKMKEEDKCITLLCSLPNSWDNLVVAIGSSTKYTSPTLALVEKTPQELWSTRKLSIAHLRVFGCDTFMHVLKEERSKLDNKVENASLLVTKME